MPGTSGSARATLDGFSIGMRELGLCFYVAWIEVVFSGDAFVPAPWMDPNASIALYPASTLGLAAALLAMAFAARRAGLLLSNCWLTYVAAILGSACTYFACVPGELPAPAHFVIAFVMGACTAVIAMRGGMLISELDSRTAAISLALIQVIAVLMFSFGCLASTFAGPVFAALVLCTFLPLGAILLELGGAGDDCSAQDFSLTMPKGFWRLVVALAVLEFACASVRGFFPGSLGDEQFSQARWLTAVFMVIAMSAIMVIIGCCRIDAPFGGIFYNMLFAVTIAVAMVPLLGYGSAVSGVLATVLFSATLLVAWAILLRVSYRSGASVVTVFGIGYAIAALGSDGGFTFGVAMSRVGLDNWLVTLINVAVVLGCVALAFVLLRRENLLALMEPIDAPEDALFQDAPFQDAPFQDALSQESLGDQGSEHVSAGEFQAVCQDAGSQAEGMHEEECLPHEDVALPVAGGDVLTDMAEHSRADSSKALFRARCEYIAEKYGLSEREADVFNLMARGSDARAIADSLVVSYNTARTHIRNIYAKMDVHSRHEFFDTLNDPENRI